MADITVKVLQQADSYALISLAEAKVYLGISSADTSGDEQLQMLIDMNSATVSELCNRVFAKEKVRETWRCIGPVCCPDGSCRIFLTHYPVKEDDIESIDSPLGSPVFDYEIEEESGKLILFGGCDGEIVVTYTGGYDLPDGAPDSLKQATGLLVRSGRTEAASESLSGVRMIAHKESRIMFHPPSKSGGTSTSSSSGSAAQQQVKGLLMSFQRIWV
jgi:hypothetical protein